jgi:predicted acylesterase/phospholipase RssA
METREKNSIALVISGGGAMGAFAVGAIKHIYGKYRDTGWFSIVGGTSTGALMAPFAALLGASSPETSQKAMELLIEQYSGVATEDILEKKSPIDLLKYRGSLFRSTPLRKRLDGVFSQPFFECLKRADMPYCYVVYTNFRTGVLETASPRDPGMSRERFIDAMIASASVPIVMEPVVINGDDCYDGGARDIIPVSRAIDLGAETILPIVLNADIAGDSTGRFRSLDKVLKRTLAIMFDEIWRNDLQTAKLVNTAIRAKQGILKVLASRPFMRRKVQAIFEADEYKSLFGKEKRLVRIIEGLHPDKALTDNSLQFKPSQMRSWIELGEEKAASVLKESPF